MTGNGEFIPTVYGDDWGMRDGLFLGIHYEDGTMIHCEVMLCLVSMKDDEEFIHFFRRPGSEKLIHMFEQL